MSDQKLALEESIKSVIDAITEIIDQRQTSLDHDEGYLEGLREALCILEQAYEETQR